ncbi:hypothetical protein [Novosphingobium resinovorum]|uniref:hypothetical protein n=1 Tax=Novosphingobium resinovorum TaxID=158500 RepID=UPI0012EAF094|nr:hypothetical protein [Novosphingobium resinovorum]
MAFVPTPAEAARIALKDGADGVAQLRYHVEALEITNIRVIRKIGVLTGNVLEILAGKPKEIVDRAITSVALAGWSVFEPDRAPSPENLKSFDPLVDELVREPGDGGAGAAQKTSPGAGSWLAWGSPTRTNWTASSLMVPLGGTSMKMLSSRSSVNWKASSRDMSRAESYSRAWDDYWGSFAGDEAKVVERILEAARENLDAIDPPSLNAAVRLLRDVERGEDASILIADYAAKRQGNHLDFTVGPTSEFAKGNVDPELGNAFEQILAMPVDRRSALEVFQTIARENRWTSTNMTLLSRQTPIELEQIIEAASGPDLKKIVQVTLSMMSSTDDEHAELRSKLRTAL